MRHLLPLQAASAAGVFLTAVFVPHADLRLILTAVFCTVWLVLCAVPVFRRGVPADAGMRGSAESGPYPDHDGSIPVYPADDAAPVQAGASGAEEPPAEPDAGELELLPAVDPAEELRERISTLLTAAAPHTPAPPEQSFEPARWEGELERLESGVRSISENVTTAFGIADNLSKTAQEAFDISQQAERSIQNVTETLTLSINQADQLYEQSVRINRILEFMSEISSKTHVLSINASIVSARAGTHGKAFDVVAREIRNLSRETERSLAEIEKLTNEIRSSITRMVETAKNASESISSEKNSLISVAGALQGAVLGVEVIRTVSGVAQEKSAEQQAILGALKELSGACRASFERAGAELSRADELAAALRTLAGSEHGRKDDSAPA